MAPRVIKRYGNRKLYDVDASAYVSMDELAALIRAGHTLQVIDNVSGEDITAQTLTQVVLEQGRRGGGLMPTDLLHDLLRRGGKALDAGVEQLRHGVEGVAQRALAPLTRVVQAPQEKEMRLLRQQISALESTLGELLERHEDARREADRAEVRRPAAKRAAARKKPRGRTDQ